MQKAWNPTAAASVTEHGSKVRDWKTNYRYYREAGAMAIP